MKILIVDDIRDDRRVLRYIAQSRGYEAIEAADGQEGLELAAAHMPDLIISDALMPRMDGFEFLRAIKKDDTLRSIPFIFYSATYRGQQDVQLGLSLGAEVYIIKPTDPMELWEEVEHVLRGGKKEKIVTPKLIEEDAEYLKRYSHIVAVKLEMKVKELEESRQTYKALAENLPGIVYRIYIRENNRTQFFNRAVEAITGYADKDLTAGEICSLYSLILPEDRDRMLADVKRAVAENKPFRTEYRLWHKNGSIRYVLEQGTPIQGPDEKPLYIEGVIFDITERQQNIERIRRQLDRLAALRSIDMAITASLDIRITVNILLDAVIRQLRVDAVSLLVDKNHMNIFEYMAGRGFRTDAIRHSHVRIGQGYAGRAALTHKLFSLSRISREKDEPKRPPFFDDEGFKTYFAMPLITKSRVIGVMELFCRSFLEPEEEWFDFLDAFAGQAAIAIDNASLLEDLRRSNDELIMAYDSTLEGWSRILDYRDKETEGHSRRVAEMTLTLARKLKLDEQELVHIRRGALLHDIGKMGVPDEIFFKPGQLSEDERAIMERHPQIAYELLFPIEFLRPAIDIPYCHHETWDGSGYPRGLKGEQIPLSARLFAVVDVYDALTSERPYRHAWPKEKVLEYLQRQAGKEFDPVAVKEFVGSEK